MPHIHTISMGGKNIETYEVSREILTRFAWLTNVFPFFRNLKGYQEYIQDYIMSCFTTRAFSPAMEMFKS